MKYIKMTGGQLGGINFEKDVPFPEINLIIYNEIYYVEQWLRRILLSALVFTYGQGWINAIPARILAELNKRKGNAKGKILLDCENSANIIWLLTLDELNKLIADESLWPILSKYISISRTELREKIDILREIRNVISHNRAATKNTWRVLSGALDALNEGIADFKSEITNWGKIIEYPGDKEVEGEYIDQKGEAIFEYFNTKKYPQDHKFILAGKEHFYILQCYLTSNEVDILRKRFVNVARLLESFKDLEASVLSFDINAVGTEIVLFWPRNVTHENHFHIIDRIFSVLPKIWTNQAYTQQSPRYICDPKIWFHGIPENGIESST